MTSTRDRIVKAASSLFYTQGIKAVSVDAIAEKAGITKRSLYYHFKSKDDLIEAYLDRRDQPNLDAFETWFRAAEGDVGAKARAIFNNLAASARSPKWKGCGFLRTSAELVLMPGHPALKVANRHKTNVERWLATVLKEAGLANASAEAVSRQIRLLLDGSLSVVLMNRDPAYMEAAGEAAETLVRVHLPKPEPTGTPRLNEPASAE